MAAGEATVTLGRIVGVHGVRGMVKIHSDCRPREAIFHYSQFLATPPHGGTPLTLTLVHGRTQGQGLIATFRDITDRDQAHALRNYNLAVLRSALPDLPPGEFYWTDLVGLAVVNTQGVLLGQVTEVFETGANDVLVVRAEDKTETLIPFIMNRYVLAVDFSTRHITVDWDSDWLAD